MYGQVKEEEQSRTRGLNITLCSGRERQRMGAGRQRGEKEGVKRKCMTLGWVQGLGDGEGASLFYFRLTRLCAPFLSVAPSLFHTLVFFLCWPPSHPSIPTSLLLSSEMRLREKKGLDKFKGKKERWRKMRVDTSLKSKNYNA